MSISEIYKITKLKLKGNYLKAIGITLLFSILSYALMSLSSNPVITNKIVSTIIALITNILLIPISYGYFVSLVKLYRNEKVGPIDFISIGLSAIKKILILAVLVIIKLIPYSLLAAITFLVATLLGINGLGLPSTICYIACVVFLLLYIYKTIDYMFIIFVLYDNYKLDSKTIIKKCPILMKNLKIKYILFNFLLILPYILMAVIAYVLVSFVPYGILIAFPFLLISLLLIQTFISFSWITFYDEASELNSSNID